jgi:hypothetical protein
VPVVINDEPVVAVKVRKSVEGNLESPVPKEEANPLSSGMEELIDDFSNF